MNNRSIQLADGDKFFWFSADIGKKVFWATLDLPAVRGILTGEVVLPDVVTGRHEMGRKIPGDVIGSTHGLDLLSDRVLDLMTSAGFTGWRSKPCHLKTKHGGNIDGYNLLLVDGRAGTFDLSLSEKIERPTQSGYISESWQGVTFNLSTWDRSDIFVPEGSSAVFVTERVRTCFLANRVTGASFERLSKMLAFPNRRSVRN